MSPPQKSLRLLFGTLAVYAVLCATHLGEFWPFSIYPMFSQAGHPWTRALVREVPPDLPDSLLWQPASLQALPGRPFALQGRGIAQNDVANYVSKTKEWDATRLRGLQALFTADSLRNRRLLVVKMQGSLSEAGGSVAVTAMPFLLMTPDSVYLNPAVAAHP